jgi:phosphoribosylformylglycinamidine (FGAM) synthase-like enzyme
MDRREPVGVTIDFPSELSKAAHLFGEAPGRVVVSVASDKTEALKVELSKHNIPITKIGKTGGERFSWEGFFELSLDDLIDRYYNAIPELMG